MKKARYIWCAPLLFIGLGGAQAEELSMQGEFAANFREASMLSSLTIEQIGGHDGPALRFAIEQALGDTHFVLLGGRTGRSRAEGTISGTVTADSVESRFSRKEKECVERDPKKKCIRREDVMRPCIRRTVTVDARIRLTENAGGRILYSQTKPYRNEVSWCRGDSAPTTEEEAIGIGLGVIAREVRLDIAPEYRTYDVRVRESTKGMGKADAARFKEIVRMTKIDAYQACAAWQAMYRGTDRHPSLLFNMALCAEQAGDYDRAMLLYHDAGRAGAGEAAEGMRRGARLIAGRADAAARGGIRR